MNTISFIDHFSSLQINGLPYISALSVLLPSGLIIKCSLLRLPQVIKIVEPLYDA